MSEVDEMAKTIVDHVYRYVGDRRQLQHDALEAARALIAAGYTKQAQYPVTSNGNPVFADGSRWCIKSYLAGVANRPASLGDELEAAKHEAKCWEDAVRVQDQRIGVLEAVLRAVSGRCTPEIQIVVDTALKPAKHETKGSGEDE